MKRVFEHPPEALTGKRYWRSLGELSDTPEFRGWLEREFPAGAAQLEGDEWSRRSFLKLMGASMALAGFGLNSCRRPEAHLVPFTKSVGVGDSGQAALLRDRDAAAQRCVAARRHDASMAGRSRSMAIRCIPRAAARPTPSRKLRFSISTIRRARKRFVQSRRQSRTGSRGVRKISERTADEDGGRRRRRPRVSG